MLSCLKTGTESDQTVPGNPRGGTGRCPVCRIRYTTALRGTRITNKRHDVYVMEIFANDLSL